MKRIVVIMALWVASIMPLMAQYNKGTDVNIIMGAQFRKYATGWTHPLTLGLLAPVSERWRIGGGASFGGKIFGGEPQGEKNPYKHLESNRDEYCLTAIAQYLVYEKDLNRHSVIIQLFGGWSEIGFCASDKHAEHRVDSEGGGSYTSYEYDIIPSNEDWWGPRFQIATQLSYAYDLEHIHLEVGVGYEFVDPIREQYYNTPITLSSNWDGFNTYYPQMTINPFKDWDCGRKIGGLHGFYLSFGCWINLY